MIPLFEREGLEEGTPLVSDVPLSCRRLLNEGLASSSTRLSAAVPLVWLVSGKKLGM
jgi:hypothetical protein